MITEMKAILAEMETESKQAFSSLSASRIPTFFAEGNRKKEVLGLYFPFVVKINRLLGRSDGIAAKWSEALCLADAAMDETGMTRLRQLTEDYFSFRQQIGMLLEETEQEAYKAEEEFRPRHFVQAAAQMQYAIREYSKKLI